MIRRYVYSLCAVTGSTNVTKTNINPPSGFVAIPTTTGGAQGPTGVVANTNTLILSGRERRERRVSSTSSLTARTARLPPGTPARQPLSK